MNKIITWNFIKKFNKKPPLFNLPRDNKINESYINHINECNHKYGSISNYIYKKHFSNKSKKYTIVKNNFPYITESNIKHLLIWFNPNYYNHDLNFNKEDTLINSIIHEHNSNCCIEDKINNYIYFENYASNKSVLGVKHIHLFVKC